jgi:LemA protein
MSVVATLVVVGVLGLWAARIYNRLAAFRKQVVSGWRHVDRQLKRRHDLIANLASTVALDPEAVETVIAARNRAAAAVGPADSAQKETELTDALDQLLALAERSPNLTANPKLHALREELTSAARALDSASQAYNGMATKYNAVISVAPNSWIAGFGGFRQAERFVAAVRPGSRT